MPTTRRQLAARKNPWVQHLAKYRASHPHDPDAMRNARRTYRAALPRYRAGEGSDTMRNSRQKHHLVRYRASTQTLKTLQRVVRVVSRVGSPVLNLFVVKDERGDERAIFAQTEPTTAGSIEIKHDDDGDHDSGTTIQIPSEVLKGSLFDMQGKNLFTVEFERVSHQDEGEDKVYSTKMTPQTEPRMNGITLELVALTDEKGTLQYLDLTGEPIGQSQHAQSGNLMKQIRKKVFGDLI